MNEALFNELRELSWRRPLTQDEEARVHSWLVEHPEARALWEEDQALNEQLRRVPDVPLASNFTARVLAEVEAESARGRRAHAAGWAYGFSWWRRLAPRLAVAGLLLFLGLSGVYQYQAYSRAELARSVEQIAEMMRVPGPAALPDFEAIRYIPSATDDDLLSALQ